MSKQRTGNFIAGGNPQVPSLTTNNGVFDSNEVYTAVNNNAWQPSGSGTYEFARSLRFRASAVTTLTKTFSNGNTQRFTYSFWVKKGYQNTDMEIFSSAGPNHPGGADISYFGFAGGNELHFYHYPNGGSGFWLIKSHLLRDHSAWYHVVLSCDTTQAVAANRARMWINGVEQIKTDNTYPGLNSTSYYFSTRQQMWGQEDGRNRYPFDGYLTEVHAIDGQALDQTYFGYFDNLGIWQPKRYTGSYGTNGYYFPFTDNQTTLNLGRNFSGSNYFTYSEQFDNGAWSKYQSSVTANATTAPDGTTTADKLVGTTGTTGDHQVSQSGIVTAVNGGVYTFSCYAKAAERSVFRLYLLKRDGATYAYSDFNLTDGTLDHSQAGPFAGAIPTITSVGNGWYRCAITVDIGTGAGGVTAICSYASATGETAGWGLFIWGAQLNRGTTVDRYIQTVASASNNDWTTNNFSLTAGNTYDSMVDSPTNVFTTATDIGGVVPGNYCTWNPVNSANVTLTNGNLGLTNYNAGGSNQTAIGTIGVTSGKWYFEYVVDTSSIPGGHASSIGVVVNRTLVPASVTPFGGQSNNLVIYGNLGRVYKAGSVINDLFSWPVGSVLQIALDVDEQKIWFGVGGTWYNSGNPATGVNPSNTTTSLGTGLHEIITADGASVETNTNTVNFGQRPFAYAPPAGFKSLNTTNLQALGSD